MPLSTVCVSTVSNRPRLWSSQTNIRIRDKDEPPPYATMNSTEEIAIYRSPPDFYPTKRSTLSYSYDFPEKTTKKEKKWSIGSLFRRKKKDESESSSDEDRKKGFLNRRRRKSDGKRRKPKTLGGFDHVVLSKAPAYNHHEDTGILSDPSGGFSNYIGRTLPLIPSNNPPQSQNSYNSFTNLNSSVVSVGSLGSADSISKKKGKGMIKARAAARRTAINNESSSDEDSSLRSNSSLRMRSDESLARPISDNGHSRKSRSARTERYLKRHSRDGENPHNYLRLSKSDADDTRSPSRSPNLPMAVRTDHSSIDSSNISGLSTIPPPSHGAHGKYRVSNSTSNPSYKPPLSMNDYNNSQRSISCDANIHKAPSFEDNNIMHVQFPIMRPSARGYRNFSLIDSGQVNCARQPPQPPPRDPNRTVVSHYFENSRPNTFYLDSSLGQTKSKSFNSAGNKFLQPKMGSFNFGPSSRSNSEVHIPSDSFNLQATIRPASTTPEPKPYRYLTRRDERHTVDGYNYLADRYPRSRKPIVIQSSSNKVEPRKDSPTQKAMEFWKQREENQVPKPVSKPVSNSPQMFTSQTRVQSQVYFPSPVLNESSNLEASRGASPFKPVSPTVKEIHKTELEDSNRKSTNLEEALDELEAIYNSLRLGDENLLDRAEQREKETLIQKAEEAKKANSKGKKGALSDSSFSYEPFDQVDGPKKKRLVRRSRIPDTKEDDMYNRKLVREKAVTISDPQSVISKVSYLLSSPIQAAYDSEGERKKETKVSKEPDTTFDDVTYRNLKHAQGTPRVIETQPPFGIPLGPVTPSANSDYLHATPENVYTPVHKQTKIPDIVKDDLAFRNLRKDSNKEPVLPHSGLDLNYLKKRRAVRSLSANIGNILGKSARSSEEDVENELKNKTLTDIADAMEIARQVLQEKGKNICNTRKAFMSDTEVRPNGDAFRESRRKFLNGLKNADNQMSSRPPKGLTPERKLQRTPTKESTPIPKSALEDDKSDNSSLDDLLNALAEEAKVTTERITKELEELEQKRCKKEEEVDLKPCQKLLKAVVDKNEAPCEVVQEIKVQIPPVESAVIVQSCFDASSKTSQESEHDYENIDSEDDKIDVDLMEKEVEKEEFQKCQSPFEERKHELVATFQELKKDIDDIQVPKFEAKTDSIYDNIETTTQEQEGERSAAACPSTPSKQPPLKLESLKSPRLVLETARKCTSRDLDLQPLPGASRSRDDLDDFDAKKPGECWYHDPAKVAVACTYGLACAHQLAYVDITTVLGLLFAVMSFVVALFL
ncbi:uncharacterized protein LOC115889647 isoform X3 [Sitophilus oryzae]|uniref:Uncharacterized protein LOC115889647 isoform X3 n=1 Tax=Sitophilus oryzae TaxID=7048 RepID=A0A6J2YQE0_SITOR|nr:uncharacterized protein LOC115889647 isoform X3 [Sitophilus oryzae]